MSRGRSALPVVRYAGGWLVAGALVGTLLALALRDDALRAPARGQPPPLLLGQAAHAAGCRLQVADARAGPRVPAASPRRVAAAVEHGLLVVTYDGELSPGERAGLAAVLRTTPRGVLVTRARTGPHLLRARAWRRELRCPRATSAALRAVELFRVRYLGRRP